MMPIPALLRGLRNNTSQHRLSQTLSDPFSKPFPLPLGGGGSYSPDRELPFAASQG